MLRVAQSLACIYYVSTDILVGFARSIGVKSLGSGKRHARYSPEKSAAYTEEYTNVFLRLLGTETFQGDICEIGPGDSISGAILMFLRGADSVTFYERFQLKPSHQHTEQIAKILFERECKRLSGMPHSENIQDQIQKVRFYNGSPAEDHFIGTTQQFDLILSNSVIQHACDPINLLQLCYERLKPGGRMIHVIDLRNAGLLESWGELAWLRTPPWLHRLMIRHTGRPNRIRFNEYRNWLESTPAKHSIYVRHLVGETKALGDIPFNEVTQEDWRKSLQLVRDARSDFTPSLRSLCDRDHAIATFIIMVKKY